MNIANNTFKTLKDLDKVHYLHPFTDLKEHKQKGGDIISRAEHIYIYNSEGKQLLDGMSGLWCSNLGYSQPTINKAITEQLEVLPYYNSFFQCTHELAVDMANSLVEVTPPKFNKVFFTNSGSEANDTNLPLLLLEPND